MNNKLRITQVGILAMGFGLAGSAVAAGFPFFSAETRMRVGRHTSTPSVSNTTHNTNFANATTALQNDSGSNDVACNLTLSRLDTMTFSDGTDIVDTDAEYTDTRDNDVNSYATIVTEVNYCEGMGSFAGCGSPQGGAKGFLVEQDNAISAAGGILYAHEFGHTAGLGHDNTGNQIMDPDAVTTADVKVTTATVCNTFRRPFVTTCPTGTGLSGPAICSPSLSRTALPPAPEEVAGSDTTLLSDETDFTAVPIEDLAQGLIVDSIPHEVESFYGQDDVDVLVAMLSTVAERRYKRTIVTLIGLISDGSVEDVFAIQDYMGSKNAHVSAAMFALGYLVNRTGSDVALDILLGAFEEGDARTSNAAMRGLAVSGDAVARLALTNVSATVADSARRKKLQFAIQENKVMAEIGLHAYYSHR
jgi:hypothetical protein